MKKYIQKSKHHQKKKKESITTRKIIIKPKIATRQRDNHDPAMQFINIITLFLAALTSADQTKINLFIKPIDGQSSDSIGFINDNSVYLVDTELDPSKSYCIGTKDLENHECFTFINGVSSLNNTVIDAFIDENGDITRLALNFDESSKPTIRKHKVHPAAIPNMNAESIKNKDNNNNNRLKIQEKSVLLNKRN